MLLALDVVMGTTTRILCFEWNFTLVENFGGRKSFDIKL